MSKIYKMCALGFSFFSGRQIYQIKSIIFDSFLLHDILAYPTDINVNNISGLRISGKF